jgi:hypothetical protein
VLGIWETPSEARAEKLEYTLLLMTPRSLDRADIAQAAAMAFTGRKWTVQSADDDHVVGFLNHRGIVATLDLKILDDRIVYSCECNKKLPRSTTRRINYDGSARHRGIVPYVPEGWIANIRKDLIKNLTWYAVSSRGPVPRSAVTTKQRL